MIDPQINGSIQARAVDPCLAARNNPVRPEWGTRMVVLGIAEKLAVVSIAYRIVVVESGHVEYSGWISAKFPCRFKDTPIRKLDGRRNDDVPICVDPARPPT